MKKLSASFLLLLLVSIFTFISCKTSDGDENKDGKDSINSKNLTPKLPKKLIVEGELIPVYTDSDMKEQKFSLNSGDECTIIEKGPFATVQNVQDFWYHIEFNGKKGWVFGAYSTLKHNSEFEVFLREFNKDKPDTLSRKHSIDFLNGKPGFKPLQYKRLGKSHYAALFYNQILYPEVELLLIIYQFSKPIKEYSLFQGGISNCTEPKAAFTSREFIKFSGPSCGKNVLPIKYYQILEDYSIKEVKSSIMVASSAELVPAITGELEIIDASISNERKCTVHSSVKEAYAKENFIFYTVIRDECSTFCISRNNTLIALQDSNKWSVKFEEPGGFKAIYQSGIEGKYIVVLEEFIQNHIVERIKSEEHTLNSSHL